MLGKKFTKNLVSYFESLSTIDVSIYTFDQNVTKELPCIVVGFSNEETSFPGNHGHYTIRGFASCQVQGYEDSGNALADALGEAVVDSLVCGEPLFNAMNRPATGTDTRPITGISLKGLFVREVSRNDEGNSTFVEVVFDAFCGSKD